MRSGYSVSWTAKPSRKELGIPRDLDVHAVGGQCRCTRGQLGCCSDGDGRLADDERPPLQPRHQGVDDRVHVPEIGAVFALLLRGAHTEEMHVGEVSGRVIVGSEPQSASGRCCPCNIFRSPGS